MKTDFRIQNWLRCAVIMFLAVAGSLTASAQEIEGGEAFYIYQNDGHFDGFFYDQVKQIRYSRFDTLGIERSEYVSQEIVTEDSVYRIMLTAIDSVSFVQPEIRFAKGVRFMRDEGMMDYYVTCTDMDLVFDISMPKTLRPNVGDVLSCTELEGHEGAFVGKVASVKEKDGSLVVECDYVNELSDVFDQFITVEQVQQVETPEGSRMRRRIAGLNAPKRIDGNFNVNLFQASTDMEANLYLAEKCKVGFGMHFGMAMAVKAVYNCTWGEFYIKTELLSQFDVGAKFSFDGQIDRTFEPDNIPGLGALIARFSRVPFPANFPMMYIEVVPKPVVRVEGHFNLAYGFSRQTKMLAMSMEIMDHSPYLTFRANLSNAGLLMPVETSTERNVSLTAELNGMVHPCMKFPINIGNESWMQYLAEFKCGNDLFVGPKLTGSISYDLLKDNDNIYDTFKDTKLNFTLVQFDDEYGATFKAFKKKWELKETKSFGYGSMDFTLFPSISDMEVELTGDNEDVVTCQYKTEGDVFYPQKLGVGLYTKANEDDIEYTKLYRSKLRDEFYFMNTFNNVDVDITNIDAGEYRVRPLIVHALLGYIPVYSQEQVVIIEPKELTLKPEEITAEEEGGDFVVTLVSKQDMPITANPNDNWITTEIVGPSGGEKYRVMKVKVAENNTDAYRTGTVTVRQRYSQTEFVEKTLTVKQYGGLQLSPSLLVFPKEGGTNTVNILTSMDPVTIDLNDGKDWLDYDLQSRTLTITASENTGAQRTATVIVSAWSSRHNGFNTTKLTVRQDGAVNASVQPSALTFQPNGGTQQVSVTLGAGVTLTGATVSEDAKDWLIVEKGTSHVNITAMPNTVAQQRQGTVYCEVTKDDTGEMVEMPVSVTQEMSTASISPASLLFAASGGVQQARIDKGNFAYCDVLSISDEGKGWVSATADTDGTVNVTVEANGLSVQRECTVNCWVSSVKSPSYEEMMILPLKVIQEPRSALEPVTPDGDKSPFSYITFNAERYVEYISAIEGKADTIVRIMPSFVFKPDNAQFTVKYGKDVNHYECVGYQEWSSNDTKTRATLSFDVEKKTDKVKNVRYVQDSESHLSITIWGATGNLTSNASMAMTVNEFPLEVNGRSYKHGKYAIADGLLFSSFNAVQDARTTYTLSELGKEIYGEEGIDPVSEHVTYQPYNDPRDYVEIYISYKEGQGEPIDLEWPESEVMASLKKDGMPVYEGNNPPEVSGTYQLSPFKLVADPTGNAGAEMVESGLDGVVLKFSGQADGEINVSMYFTANGVASEADNEMKALITGNGNQFSICVPDGYGGANIISGVIDNGAINDLHLASCDMKKAGQHVVLTDDDGYSSTTTWSPGNDE